MIVKAIEIRDRATFIPAIAIKMIPANEEQRWLLRMSGYNSFTEENNNALIMLSPMAGGTIHYDPYHWSPFVRTFRIAHEYVQKHFDDIEDGAVIDVEFIAGETLEPKQSEKPKSY